MTDLTPEQYGQPNPPTAEAILPPIRYIEQGQVPENQETIQKQNILIGAIDSYRRISLYLLGRYQSVTIDDDPTKFADEFITAGNIFKKINQLTSLVRKDLLPNQVYQSHSDILTYLTSNSEDELQDIINRETLTEEELSLLKQINITVPPHSSISADKVIPLEEDEEKTQNMVFNERILDNGFWHDINNPLTPLINQGTLLERKRAKAADPNQPLSFNPENALRSTIRLAEGQFSVLEGEVAKQQLTIEDLYKITVDTLYPLQTASHELENVTVGEITIDQDIAKIPTIFSSEYYKRILDNFAQNVRRALQKQRSEQIHNELLNSQSYDFPKPILKVVFTLQDNSIIIKLMNTETSFPKEIIDNINSESNQNLSGHMEQGGTGTALIEERNHIRTVYKGNLTVGNETDEEGQEWATETITLPRSSKLE